MLHDFVRREALPGSGVDEAAFWAGLEAILDEFAPRNRALLATRDELQAKLDEFHAAAPGPVDQAAYEAFLREIGYLVDEPADVKVETSNVDAEVAIHGRPAAGRAGTQRPVRRQRGQRAVGLALRRALRHRRDPAGRRARAPGRRTTPPAARR